MNTIQISASQNVTNTETHHLIMKKMPDGKTVTVNTSQHGYIPTETKENPHRALTSEATEKYSTDESFKNQVIEFLDFVSATTKNQVINLPESKHHGKLREKYIKEDKFLTTSKKEGSKDWGCRLLAEIGLTSKLDSTCTHGTNLYSFLIATKTSDGYLLPLNKQIKRFGLAQTGEQRKGYRPLNRKYISSIGLEFYQSSFKYAIKYSKYNSSSNISSSELFASQILTDNYPEPILKTYEALSKIPVVLIGYGASRGHTSSGIQHEHVYKRLEVRTVAVPDNKIKNDLENLLPKINPNRNFNVILISDIEHIEEKNEPCKRTSYNDKPDYITLGIIDPKD